MKGILVPRIAGEERFLLAALFLLLLVIWVEPPGSWLAEPDEIRYAEIPREMLASGDFLTPRLSGMPFFEKPPLLYWMNAASFRLFGESPWAARLPARLAGSGTALLLLLWVRAIWGRTAGFAAAILYLVSPLGFALSRLNITDGLLTFFWTATLLGAYTVILRREKGLDTRVLSVLTGIMAAGGFLTKGLVAVVLPVTILILWCLATGRLRAIGPLIASPALIVFLVAATPWFLLMEQRHPGFLEFFFVREHLQRFTTSFHHREGPFYFFVLVFLAGFLPGLPFLARVFRQRERPPDLDGIVPPGSQPILFCVLWLSTVLLFFSVSHSKLIPYLLPAFPPAAALAAAAFRRLGRNDDAVWKGQGLLALLLAALAVLYPRLQWGVVDRRLSFLTLIAAASLCGGAWVSWRNRRRPAVALSFLASGWAGFYGAAVLAWTLSPSAIETHDLGRAAKIASRKQEAVVASFLTYLHGLPWELKSPVRVVGYPGEMNPSLGGVPATFWSESEFWKHWGSAKPLVALVRDRELQRFAAPERPAEIIARGKRHFLIANFAPPFVVTGNPLTSAGLYRGEPGEARVALSGTPPIAFERARRESSGEAFVWAIREAEDGETVYEFITAGRRPRAIEVSGDGQFRYVEEEIPPGELPKPVLERLSRTLLLSRVAFATKEYRRTRGPDVLYEVYVQNFEDLEEFHFRPSGEIYRGDTSPSANPSKIMPRLERKTGGLPPKARG